MERTRKVERKTKVEDKGGQAGPITEKERKRS